MAWPRLAWPRPGLVLAWPGLAQPHLARVADWRPEWADLLATWLSGFHVYMQGSHSQDLTKVEKTSAQKAQKWVPKMESEIAATECSPIVDRPQTQLRQSPGHRRGQKRGHRPQGTGQRAHATGLIDRSSSDFTWVGSCGWQRLVGFAVFVSASFTKKFICRSQN